jgi:hypothetical protein
MAAALARKTRTLRLLALTLLGVVAVCADGRSDERVTRTSRPVRLLRQWEESVKSGGREHARRVVVLFDYARGVAIQESRDLNGTLISSRKITESMPAPSPEEIAEAFAIARSSPGLSSLFGRFAIVTEGGFLLQESVGMPCGPGSRCLHVFLLSADRSGLIRRVVVDLTNRSIPYPVYTPPFGTHGR